MRCTTFRMPRGSISYLLQSGSKLGLPRPLALDRFPRRFLPPPCQIGIQADLKRCEHKEKGLKGDTDEQRADKVDYLAVL